VHKSLKDLKRGDNLGTVIYLYYITFYVEDRGDYFRT